MQALVVGDEELLADGDEVSLCVERHPATGLEGGQVEHAHAAGEGDEQGVAAGP